MIKIIKEFCDEQMCEYQLNTVTFRQSCVPFLAIRSVQQLTNEGKNRYPCASRVLLQDLYVDDIRIRVESIDEAKILINMLTELLKFGQFKLHK